MSRIALALGSALLVAVTLLPGEVMAGEQATLQFF